MTLFGDRNEGRYLLSLVHGFCLSGKNDFLLIAIIQGKKKKTKVLSSSILIFNFNIPSKIQVKENLCMILLIGLC